MKRVVLLILIIVGVSILFYIFSNDEIQNRPVEVIRKTVGKIPQVSPTPFPFQELTIPYLRSLEFKSSISKLDEISINNNYKTYTTSYISDGFKINALLTKPTGEIPNGGFPAIVFVHGYIPPAQYKTHGSQYADYVEYLANHGFVVFKIDLRGHGNSEGEAGGAYFSSDYIIDTLNAYSALQNANFVNPEKIGLWGHSMAGNIVLRSMAVKIDIPVAVIWSGAVYTYSDMSKYGIQDSSYQRPPINSDRNRERDRLMQLHGRPIGDGAFWKLVAATNFLDDIKGKIQINHAIDDPVVNIGYSRDLKAMLDNKGVGNRFIEYQNGGHNITGVSFNTAMEDTVEFYSKYLK